jgi:hypothetical protein
MFIKMTGPARLGTSFHNVTVEATYEQLVGLLGQPNGAGDGYKVNHEWFMRDDESGAVATIYDWKLGFQPVGSPARLVEWHLGAKGHYGDLRPVEVCRLLKRQLEAGFHG